MSKSDQPKSTVRGSEFIAAAAAIAAGSAAYADVVRFDDTGNSFGWSQNVLDITKSADAQPGLSAMGGATTAYQYYRIESYPVFSYETSYQTSGGIEIFSGGFSDHYAKPLDAGTVIGPTLADGSFTGGTVFEFSFSGCELEYDPKCYCYKYVNCFSGERGIIPEGVETYLGVRFDAGAGTQYGWVKVIRNFASVEALAWGFQTDPGVPIAAGATTCDGDLDATGEVDFDDLLTILSNWGMDGDGADLASPFDEVGFADLVVLLSAWGPCAPPDALIVEAPVNEDTPPTGTLASLAHGSRNAE